MSILISLVGTIIFAHYLTEKDFGIYRYLVSLSVLFGSFTLTGVGQAIMQASAKNDTWYLKHGNHRTRYYNFIASGIAILGSLYYTYQANYLLAWGCGLIAILQPSSIYFLNALAFLHGQKKFKEATFLQASRSLLITLTSIFTVLITQNILMLICAYLGSQAIAGIISRHKNEKTVIANNIENTPAKYDNIANHASLRNIIVGTASRLDSIIVFQQLGAASLATYTISTLLPEHIKGALKNLPTLLIPRFSNRENADRPNFTHRSIQGLLLLSLFTVLVIILIPILYSVIFPKYPQAIIYTQLLALAFPASIYHIHLSWLQTQRKEKALYYSNVLTSAFQVLATFLLVTTYGILGAVIAKVATNYVQLLTAMYYTKK